MKVFNEEPCPICQSEEMVIDEGFKNTQYKQTGKIITEFIYAENCMKCGNLLYGYVKPIKEVKNGKI